MDLKAWVRLAVITIAVLAGFYVQIELVQAGYQDFVIGFALGALAYQSVSDPSWIREITEPGEVVSVMLWVLFPFVALFGYVFREVTDTLLAKQ